MTTTVRRPRVVIVGAGFGGLWAARTLSHAPVDVLLVDRDNYHTFRPLLYQVAAAELEPEEIAYPVRTMFRSRSNVAFVLGDVQRIDLQARQIETADKILPYNYLILSTGSVPFFYAVPGAAEYAFRLKDLVDAITLRNHIVGCFEQAVYERDVAQRQALLTFVIVGGGPTGVEFAGALSELINGPLCKDYPALKVQDTHLILVEAADSLLAGFPDQLRADAATRLRGLGVDVRLRTPVDRVTPAGMRERNGTFVPAMTVIWTAGVRCDPLAAAAGLPTVRNGQVRLLPTLQAPDHPEVYVVGDLAFVEQNGHPLPLVAPVATQEGVAAARNIQRQVAGQAPVPFHYADRGMLATIGRNAAVADLHWRTFSGFPAWLLWLGVHLLSLIGFRNRLFVLINWAWDYFFFERAVRLILPMRAEGGTTPLPISEQIGEKSWNEGSKKETV